MAFKCCTDTMRRKHMYGPYTSVKQINRPWVQPLTCHKNYPRPSLLLAGSEALALRELSPLRTPPENTGEEPIVCLHGEDVGVWVGSLPNCQGAAVVSLAGKLSGLPKSSGNQDAVLVKTFQPLPSCNTASILGIFDGHGKAGSSAAAYVKDAIQSKLETNAQKAVASCSQRILAFASNFVSNFQLATAASSTGLEMQLNARHTQLCLKETFRQAADLMRSISEFSQSGTTAVVCVILHDSVVAAWAGDSRAVIGTPMRQAYVATELTKDHKPNDAAELARIVAAGGKVAQVGCDRSGRPAGPYRVLLPTGVTPGLSVARAFGDNLLSKVGVVSTPDFTVFPTPHSAQIDPDRAPSILILASDGLWQFIDSQEAVDIASCANTPEEAARLLLEAAKHSWVRHCAGQHQDDISIAVVFL